MKRPHQALLSSVFKKHGNGSKVSPTYSFLWGTLALKHYWLPDKSQAAFPVQPWRKSVQLLIQTRL